MEKKKKRREIFTLMLIPHSGRGVRQITISKISFSLVLTAIVAGFLSLSFFINDYRQMRYKVARLDELEVTNQTQKEEILSLAQKISNFNEEMEKLKKLEDRLRILAGVGGSAETGKELGKGGPQDYSLLEEVMQVGDQELLPIRLIERIEESAVFLENEIERRGKGFEEVEKIVRQKKDLFASTPNIFPVQGWISGDYGPRVNPITRKREIHQAIDIVAPWGTEVRASAQGKVVSAGWKSAYGLMIRMNDGHGYQTVYGHLSRIVVKEGQRVDKGEVIGRVGSTGHSTGPHLHFEVWSEGKTVDPLGLMVEPLGEVK